MTGEAGVTPRLGAPGAYVALARSSSDHQQITDPQQGSLTEESVLAAIALMIGYVLLLINQFRNATQTLGGQGEPEGHAGPAWSMRTAIVVLLGAAALLALMSEILVSSIGSLGAFHDRHTDRGASWTKHRGVAVRTVRTAR